MEMMMMRTFKPRAFAISDFYEWYQSKQLVLNPKFQRRAVWAPQAKSNLLNTIILGLPMPIFFIRSKVDPQTKKSIREVVDGQQRLRAIFDYIDNGFTIRKSQNAQYGGYFFSELPDEVKSDILNYEISVNVLVDMDDREILDIFARLNSYGVKLNSQELINAKYFGAYKKFIYDLGYDYSLFWEVNGIFSTAQMLRMKEAEFVSELMAAILGGIQDSKSAEKYYALYDESFEEAEEIATRFRSTMDLIANVFEGSLMQSRFTMIPLLYSLFVVLYHMNYGIPNFVCEQISITERNLSKVRSALEEVEGVFTADTLSVEQQLFITACKKSTTHKINKQRRCDYIATMITKYLGE